MRKVLLVLGLVGVLTLGANEEMLKPTAYNIVKTEFAKHKPMMIEFGAESCRMCQKMGKVLYSIKNKFPKANIFFVNIYKDQSVMQKYKIRMIPTQIFFDKDGKEIQKHIGVFSEDELVEKLKKLGIINE